MRKRISIDHLAVGMFLEADVRSVIMDDGEVRYFLRPSGAGPPAPGEKRARLLRGKHLEVVNEGGLLITSETHLALLRETGLGSVYINPLKGADLPDHLRPLPEPQAPSRPDEEALKPTAGPPVADVNAPLLDDRAGRDALSYAALKAAFAAPTLEDALEKEVLAQLVVPGEEIALRVPPQAGASGQAEEMRLFAGPHVREVGGRYLSEIYGYVCALGKDVRVIPPIWISPDRVEAHFIHFPHTGLELPPERDWVMRLLEILRVRHGIQEAAIRALCNRPFGRMEKVSLLLAQGVCPVPGEDARMEFTFDLEGLRTYRYLPDGSVDLDAWRQAVGVRAGDLLARVFPATPGRAGVDLEGKEIPAKTAERGTLKAGENVRAEDQQDGALQCFYSEIDGDVEVREDTIQVRPVFRVNGDMGDITGPIDVADNLEIRGNVAAGATVQAGGSIVIGGTVNSGAVVKSQGDVVVSKGIIGEETRVFAKGSVYTRFVQNGSVMALGDVTVGSHVFKAYVRAGGRLVVQPGDGDRGGSILGGQTYAGTGLEAISVGSEAGIQTQIGVLSSPEVEAQARHLVQGIGVCQSNILRILRTLGLRDIDATALDRLIQRTPLSAREEVRTMLNKLKQWVAAKEKALAVQQRLQQERDRNLHNMEIRVPGRVFPSVRVRLGDQALDVSTKLERVLFLWTHKGISCKALG